MSELPPMPRTVFKAQEILRDPNSSFEELAKILETDQAVAARVLKLANSAYYGLVGQVSSLQHASVVLGYKTLEELITMAGASKLLGEKMEGYGLGAGDMWQHSLGVAVGSKIIAGRRNPGLANDAFAAGLIHDAGKLVLEPSVLERAGAFREFMADGSVSFLQAEKEILGFDHAEIASELCRAWHVPNALSKAVRYHHYPSRSAGDELTCIVHVADAIAMMSGIGTGIDGMLYELEESATTLLGFQEEDFGLIMVEMVEAVQKISGEMSAP
ncbi:MAG: HDOD domain-containing protein [Deltaproteobacteria bacterium]|nr:HDOD domain-containing protein [Deltaproteobacteria bacterium]